MEGFGGGFEIRKMAFELRDLKKGKGEKEGEFSFSARRFFFGKSGTEHALELEGGRRRKRAKMGFFFRRFLAR